MQSCWQEYAEETRQWLQAEDAAQARRCVEEGLERFPHQPELISLAARIALEDGDHPHGLALSRHLLTVDPDQCSGYVVGAQSLLRLGRLEEALRLLQKGRIRLPQELRLRIAVIDLYKEAGRPDLALVEAERLVEQHTENWQGQLRLAEILILLRRFEEAGSRIERAMALTSPNPPATLGRLAGFLAKQAQTASQPRHQAWVSSLSGYGSLDPAELPAAVSGETWQPFQYWSQGNPGEEIQRISAMWNSIFRRIGIAEIQLFDRAMARSWIAAHAPALLKPFETAFHYAVESDVFRLAYACQKDCIWVDSDLYPRLSAPSLLQKLLRGAGTVLYFNSYVSALTNSFFITRKQSPFFLKIAAEMADFDFTDLPWTKPTVVQTFGPGRYQKTLADLFQAAQPPALCRREDGMDVYCMNSWNYMFTSRATLADANPPFPLAYKRTSESWRRFLEADR